MHVLQRIATTVAAAGLVVGSAAAQGARPTFGISGGLSIPTGDLNKGVKSGYDIAAHVGFRPSSTPFGLRLEGAFNQFAVKSATNANTNIFDVTANAVFGTPAQPGSVRPYFLGGVGVYNVKNEAVVRNVTVSTSATKFGVNGGAGIDMPLSGISVFVEARFHYLFTDSGDNGLGYNASFVPVVVGVRF